MIRKSLGLLALVGTFVGVTAACGVDSDDGPKDKYPSADSFCTAKATEECKQASPSCAVTSDVCATKRKDVCLGAAGGATGQGRTYTPSKADACITATIDVYKDRIPDATKEKTFKATCEAVFVGAKGLSQPCTQLFECTADLTCDVEKGFCAKKVELTKVDQPCNNPGEICGTGLYCQQRGGAKFCSARNKEGDSCAADAPCLETLRCAGTSCKALQQAGQPCDTNDECATGTCNTDRKCAARQFPSETGVCKDFGGT